MDVYRVAPLSAPIDATIEVPGSKSVANRALVCAALAEGETVLRGVPDGDDTEAMLDCLRALGLEAERAGDDVRIAGGVRSFRRGPVTLPARLAGTTSRFVTALAALGPGPYTIDGHPPLRARPMAPLHDALVSMGVQVQPSEGWGHLPVTVQGPVDVTLDEVSLRGDVSSQYLTALMLIAPYFPNGLRFMLTTPLVSRPYIRITAAVMAAFGVPGVELGDRIITVPAGRYSARQFTIEPDASSASYPLAAAAICGGRVRVPGLTNTSLQGDAAFCQVLARMGCEVVQDQWGTTVATATCTASTSTWSTSLTWCPRWRWWRPSPTAPPTSMVWRSSATRRATGSAICAASCATRVSTRSTTPTASSCGPGQHTRPRWPRITTTGWRWRSRCWAWVPAASSSRIPMS